MSGPRYGSRYGTSRGVLLNQRGVFNPVPVNNYLSGDGKSHVYRGPGYYIPSERRWVTFVDYHSLPPETRRDAILMESEDQWREFQQKRDMKSFPMGITMSGHPDLHFKNPLPQLMPFKIKAWNRKWDGPGFFVPISNTWINEHDGPGIPRDSYRFHNEEDWIKFRYMSQFPELRFLPCTEPLQTNQKKTKTLSTSTLDSHDMHQDSFTQ